MRELKFRVFYKNTEIKDNFLIDTNGDLYEDTTMGILYKHDKKDYIIEQCTGLKDANDVEIYEGDILDDGEDFWVVVCEESEAMFAIKGGSVIQTFISVDSTWYEVVGNIHEDAELLEGE